VPPSLGFETIKITAIAGSSTEQPTRKRGICDHTK